MSPKPFFLDRIFCTHFIRIASVWLGVLSIGFGHIRGNEVDRHLR